MRGTPDRTAHAHGDRLRLGPTGLTSVEPRARQLLRATALGNSRDQPWGENRDRGQNLGRLPRGEKRHALIFGPDEEVLADVELEDDDDTDVKS